MQGSASYRQFMTKTTRTEKQIYTLGVVDVDQCMPMYLFTSTPTLIQKQSLLINYQCM